MFLRLKFRNAKLFRRHAKSKDKSFQLIDYPKLDYKSLNRNALKEYVEPITKYQISNMLHVLLGERPVPKNRPVPYSTLNYIDELASNSFIKLCDIKRYNKTQKKWVTYNEGINDKRALYDSWPKKPYEYTWRTIYLRCNNKELNPNRFEEVQAEFSKVIGYDVSKKKFRKVVKDIRKIDRSRLERLFKFLKKEKMTSIWKHIIDDAPITTYDGRVSITINKGMTNFQNYYGEILIPLDEQLIHKFKQSSGSATLLDGGYVYIDGILEDNEINLEYFDEFKKIGEISTEKYEN